MKNNVFSCVLILVALCSARSEAQAGGFLKKVVNGAVDVVSAPVTSTVEVVKSVAHGEVPAPHDIAGATGGFVAKTVAEGGEHAVEVVKNIADKSKETLNNFHAAGENAKRTTERADNLVKNAEPVVADAQSAARDARDAAARVSGTADRLDSWLDRIGSPAVLLAWLLVAISFLGLFWQVRRLTKRLPKPAM